MYNVTRIGSVVTTTDNKENYYAAGAGPIVHVTNANTGAKIVIKNVVITLPSTRGHPLAMALAPWVNKHPSPLDYDMAPAFLFPIPTAVPLDRTLLLTSPSASNLNTEWCRKLLRRFYVLHLKKQQLLDNLCLNTPIMPDPLDF